MRAPAFASLATLIEAALYSDLARRELLFRMRQTEPNDAVFTAPKKRKPDDTPKPCLRRHQALASAIKAANFMDETLKRAALMIGFAFLVAWCPPMTLLPSPPEGVRPSAWPLVPEPWTPASEEDFEALAGLRFGDRPSATEHNAPSMDGASSPAMR